MVIGVAACGSEAHGHGFEAAATLTPVVLEETTPAIEPLDVEPVVATVHLPPPGPITAAERRQAEGAKARARDPYPHYMIACGRG